MLDCHSERRNSERSVTLPVGSIPCHPDQSVISGARFNGCQDALFFEEGGQTLPEFEAFEPPLPPLIRTIARDVVHLELFQTNLVQSSEKLGVDLRRLCRVIEEDDRAFELSVPLLEIFDGLEGRAHHPPPHRPFSPRRPGFGQRLERLYVGFEHTNLGPFHHPASAEVIGLEPGLEAPFLERRLGPPVCFELLRRTRQARPDPLRQMPGQIHDL